jgi:APA family basic amino acid/polyamine antiporter
MIQSPLLAGIFFMRRLLRTKPLAHFQHAHLKRCLTGTDLIFLGVGAIIGAGVFVLTGIAAATMAGPAIILSYLLAGVACAFTAFSYAELSSAIGGSGSAYGYAYAGLGEIFAWVIGWCLLLEYSISVSAVAIGWSSYVNNIFQSIGFHLPSQLLTNPYSGGIINLPAVLIILVITFLLCLGVKESTRINHIIVFIKFLAIGIFIIAAVKHISPAHWKPFFPFGGYGVLQGAAIIFFAYIGFDAVSTAAEETIDPQRNLPIGIIGSLIICTVVYIVVAGLLTSIVPYTTLNVASPVSNALLILGDHFAAGFVAAGAIAGLTTVMLVMFYGLTRVFYAMSRDGLLPKVFSQVHPTTQTPIRVVITSGIIIALVSGFMPMSQIAELVNIGTLAAFVVVNLGVIVMRIRNADMVRPFKVPLYPYTPILGILFCTTLILSLSHATHWRFLIWMLIGLIAYFAYGFRHSILGKMK